MSNITILGAGSTVFARQLMTDILQIEGLDEGCFALVDIDASRLELAHQIAERLITQSGKRLAERRDFTAIVAGSDFMAIGILRALTEQGLRVPDDVSLVGFDDIDLCQYTIPPLTTVRQDRVAMGREAVHRLIAMIEGTEEVSPLILPTQLVVRKSTGPVPKELH